MEPNRTRQVIQDLARAFNKLASELTADLSYAAREIESLRNEVQRLRSGSGKLIRNSAGSKKSSRAGKKSNASHKTNASLRAGSTQRSSSSQESPKSPHEPSSFVFPQEPFSPTHPPEPNTPGNN